MNNLIVRALTGAVFVAVLVGGTLFFAYDVHAAVCSGDGIDHLGVFA